MLRYNPLTHVCHDVIVIGGGVNGAAIARDASLRGLQVLLLEARDFASGASGHNGRMIHGGLRYLATGDIGLVIEALRERRTLQHIAPHLVRESTLFIPTLRSDLRPAWMVGLGLVALNVLDLGRHPRCKWLGKSRAMERVPGLKSDNLTGGFEMYDAYAENAERLTLENVIAASEAGADVRNYAAVSDISMDANGSLRVTWREGGETHKVIAKVVVNSTGAWADEFLSQSTGSNASLITKAAGSFVVVKATKDAPKEAVFVASKIDGRPVLVTPWLGNLLIGTTDRVVTEAVDDVKATIDEIDYLFDTIDEAFAPGIIRREDTLFSYCGVRPLPYSEGASRKTTRKHVIHKHSGDLQGLISVFGGKLSTFRSLAEDVTDVAQKFLGTPKSSCQTARLPLPGAEGCQTSLRVNHDLTRQTQKRLERLYGTRAGKVLDLIKGAPDLGEVVDTQTGAIAAEFVYAVQNEFARTLSDVFLRRTLLGYQAGRGKNLIDVFGITAKAHLGWSEQKIAADIEAYLLHIDRQDVASALEVENPYKTVSEAS